MKKKKKILIVSLSVLGGIIASFCAFVGIVAGMSAGRKTNVSKDSTIDNQTNLVQARGKALYDKDGNYLLLRGVNAGNLLVSEGWLSPFSIGEKLDEEGNIIYDHDNLPTYPTLPMEKSIEGFKANPNLNDEQRKELIDIYRHNWFSEIDFKNVKDMGLNTIRLPFYWRDILEEKNGQFVRKEETEAFSYLDEFVSNCKKYGLYCVLDLHGTVGGQNGYEHSGNMEAADLWKKKECQDATADLWKYVAEHYTRTARELGESIATYDIMNEPCADFDNPNSGTNMKICAPVFDQIYKAIRSVDDQHVITIEGVWSFNNFTNPKDYGWENVQYETHFYNWNASKVPYWLFNSYHELHNWGHDYEVPYFIGEFTFFEDKDAWQKQLSMYEKRGYSWTMWTYKASVTGWWTTSWSVYTQKLNLVDGKKKANLKTDTFDVLKDAFEKTNTLYCEKSNTYQYITDFMQSRN